MGWCCDLKLHFKPADLSLDLFVFNQWVQWISTWLNIFFCHKKATATEYFIYMTKILYCDIGLYPDKDCNIAYFLQQLLGLSWLIRVLLLLGITPFCVMFSLLHVWLCKCLPAVCIHDMGPHSVFQMTKKKGGKGINNRAWYETIYLYRHTICFFLYDSFIRHFLCLQEIFIMFYCILSYCLSTNYFPELIFRIIF